MQPDAKACPKCAGAPSEVQADCKTCGGLTDNAATCPKYGGKVCRPEAGALCECYPGKKPSAAITPRFAVKFAWYDLWVGAYIDRAKRTVYICPLPTLLLVVRYA